MADDLDQEASEIGRRFRHDRRVNDNNLKSRFEEIFQKYERDFTGIGDEIDLLTGQIIVNNGHLQSMQHEADPGEDSATAMVHTFAVDDEFGSDEDATPDVDEDGSDDDGPVEDAFAGSLRDLSRQIEELSDASVYSSSGILTDHEMENDPPAAAHSSSQPYGRSGVFNEPADNDDSVALPPQIRILQTMPAALRHSALTTQSSGAQFDKALLDQLERNITGQIAQFLAASAVQEPDASAPRGPTAKETAWSYPELPTNTNGHLTSPQATRPTLPSSVTIIRQSPRKKRSLWAPDSPKASKRSRAAGAYLASPPSRMLADPHISAQYPDASSVDVDHAEDVAVGVMTDAAHAYSANTARRIAPKSFMSVPSRGPRESHGQPSVRLQWVGSEQQTVASRDRCTSAVDQSVPYDDDFATSDQSGPSLDEELGEEDFTDDGDNSDDSTTGVLYTKREDELMVELRGRQGLRWKDIVPHFPGRNMASLLNRYTYIRRRILPELIEKGEMSADNITPVYLSTKRALKQKKLRLSTSYRADALRESMLQQNGSQQPATPAVDLTSTSTPVDRSVRPRLLEPTSDKQRSSDATIDSDASAPIKEYVFSLADDRMIRRLRDSENRLFSEIALRFPGTTEQTISDRYFNHVMGKTLPLSNDPNWKPSRRFKQMVPKSAYQPSSQPHTMRTLLPFPTPQAYTSVMPIRFEQWTPGHLSQPRRRRKKKQVVTENASGARSHVGSSARPPARTPTGREADTSVESDASFNMSTVSARVLPHAAARTASGTQDDDSADELQADAQSTPVLPDPFSGTAIIQRANAGRNKAPSAHAMARPSAASDVSRVFPSSIPDTEDGQLQSSNTTVTTLPEQVRNSQVSRSHSRASGSLQQRTSLDLNARQANLQQPTHAEHNDTATTDLRDRDRHADEHAERAETALQILRAVRESKGRLELQQQIDALPSWIVARYKKLSRVVGQTSHDAEASFESDTRESIVTAEPESPEEHPEPELPQHEEHQPSMEPQRRLPSVPSSLDARVSPEQLHVSQASRSASSQPDTPLVGPRVDMPGEDVPPETHDDTSATMSSLLSSGVLYGSLARVCQQLSPNRVKNRVVKMLKTRSDPTDASPSSPPSETIATDATRAEDGPSSPPLEATTDVIASAHNSSPPPPSDALAVDATRAQDGPFPIVVGQSDSGEDSVLQDLPLGCTTEGNGDAMRHSTQGSCTRSNDRLGAMSSSTPAAVPAQSLHTKVTEDMSSDRQIGTDGNVATMEEVQEGDGKKSIQTTTSVVQTAGTSDNKVTVSQSSPSANYSSAADSSSRKSRQYAGMSLAALEKAVRQVAQRKHAEANGKSKVHRSTVDKRSIPSESRVVNVSYANQGRSVPSTDRATATTTSATSLSSADRPVTPSSSSATPQSDGRASKPRLQQRAASRKPPVVLGKSSRLSAGSAHRASTEAIRRMSSLIDELSDDELA